MSTLKSSQARPVTRAGLWPFPVASLLGGALPWSSVSSPLCCCCCCCCPGTCWPGIFSLCKVQAAEGDQLRAHTDLCPLEASELGSLPEPAAAPRPRSNPTRPQNLSTCLPFARACAQFYEPGPPYQTLKMWGEWAPLGNRKRSGSSPQRNMMPRVRGGALGPDVGTCPRCSSQDLKTVAGRCSRVSPSLLVTGQVCWERFQRMSEPCSPQSWGSEIARHFLF